MILFVFEGEEREPRIFKTLVRLFFGEGEIIVCSFGNNIYELYRQMQELEGDGDIVSVLRENEANGLPTSVRSSDFSEIYLFFDYDFQNENLTLEEMNRRLKEMLELFDDETNNGKLYVSYPMVESLCYTKELPDEQFYKYVVKRCDCVEHSFKDLAAVFSHYGSFDFIELPDQGHHKAGKREIARVKNNWIHLVNQHSAKANFICTGDCCRPEDKEAVSQRNIFVEQLGKYLTVEDTVAILNAFPLFLFEYFKELK
ncbi:MAG: hypothetical protein LIR46_07105 [Bacteroidota bacterium]|nr:hypothetical protein [Bacteroidota bacterium]